MFSCDHVYFLFSKFNFIILSNLVGVTCSYELILTAMSSLHVKVNELELDQVTEKPGSAQRSLDMYQTQTAKPIAQAEVDILLAVFFKIC